MNRDPFYTVLAFYQTTDDQAKKTFNGLKSLGVRNATLAGPGKIVGTPRRYTDLRLQQETVIVVTAALANVANIVKALEASNSPAVFVIREDRAAEDHADLDPLHAPRPELLFRARLKANEDTLLQARHDLLDAVRRGHTVAAAAEWLLDNSHLLRSQIAEVRRSLPRNYPASFSGQSYARVYRLAHELIAGTDNAVTAGNILEHLQSAQDPEPLSIADLWFFSTALRMALLDELAKLAVRINQSQQLREAAHLWANRLAAAVRAGRTDFDQMLSRLGTHEESREPYFLTALVEQLQGEEEALAPMRHWAEELAGKQTPDLVREEHTKEAAERVSTANAIGSLRTLSQIEFTKVFEAASAVDAILREDPGEVYGKSDFTTRDECRRVVERIACESLRTESEVARLAVTLASNHQASSPERGTDVTYFLLGDGLSQLETETRSRVPFRIRFIRFLRRTATQQYLGGIWLLTIAFLSLAVAFAWEGGVNRWQVLVVLGSLALFPLSELSIQIVNALVISLLPPECLPKMDFREGIPAECATLVVVPMMLTSIDVVKQEVDKLKIRRLANPEQNLFFALFSDFTDSTEALGADDAQLLAAALTGIQKLNEHDPSSPFLLFHRSRVWSECEQKWIGRERKRGKIEALNNFLAGEGHGEILLTGQLPIPIRYVITLDADTHLPPGTGRRMVETMAHPLNRVEIDPVSRTRRKGYSIIQPRVSIGLPGATASRFTRMFADTAGTDPYSFAVSDAQQDLFGEGIFHGKAIYDLHAFRTTVGNRFPVETLLSHDLIEGSYSGVGFASDIELFENLPTTYVSYCKREQRWIRGDWQIARWIFSRVPSASGDREKNTLSAISRWRILDNLRRSLTPIASLFLLLFGWFISPAPGVWSLVVAVAVVVPAFAPLFDRIARHIQGSIQGWKGAADELFRSLIKIGFLPHQAWMSADAILRALYRQCVSRRNLLEWQTAESAGAREHTLRDWIFRQMFAISGLSMALMILIGAEGAFGRTLIFLVPWALSPAIVRWLDGTPRRQTGARADTLYLRRAARRTWRYFDDLVNAESNWLPPDNSQLALRIEVAQRTSPTNIGLWLTSALSAKDLGYLTIDDFLNRCTQTLATLGRMERYEGHLLNWYDTRTLAPLLPRYVSTVDSGNLLAGLWVLERGCDDILRVPLIGDSCRRGLTDTLELLEEVSGADRAMGLPLRSLAHSFREPSDTHDLVTALRLAATPIQQLKETRRWQESGDERSYWIFRLDTELRAWTQIADRYLLWMETLRYPPDSFLRAVGAEVPELRRRALAQSPTLMSLSDNSPGPLEVILSRHGMPELRPDLQSWLDQLASQYSEARSNAQDTIARLRDLKTAADAFANKIDMSLLYDMNRRLFGVGYTVGGPLIFSSHYGLLASECRLASLLAIAKGDVPIEHWFAMGRGLVSSHRTRTLLSWSGTMFEYLMPLIFMRTFANSLLDSACRGAVERQISYGREQDVPWGVSESAYSALDSNQIYQYRAFGVPDLALGPSDDNRVVVSPYSTMLALMVDKTAAIANLKRLQDLGLDGPMGFYESIDFSRETQKDGMPGVVTYAYMAHHQGMSLLALNNVLQADIMRRRFHSDLRIRAIESLLYERVSLTPVATDEIRTEAAPVKLTIRTESAERTWAATTPVPRINLQGNGRYSVMLTNSGGGYSRLHDFAISRWRADTTRDSWGTFIYVRDLNAGTVWATTYHPAGGALGSSSATFSVDRAEYQRRVAGIGTVMNVTVAPEDDVELRRVTITNRTLIKRRLELTSYLELALAPQAADAAHPAFVKLFVETEYLENGVLLAHRRPREAAEPQIWAAHMLIGSPGPIQYETDRARFIGRTNSCESPEAMTRNLTASTGAVLDPIFSLRCRFHLEPRETVELAFLTLAASSREALLQLVEKYKRTESIARAFELAWTRAQLEFRYLGVGAAAAHTFQELAGHLIYPSYRLRATGERAVRNRLGQSGLWGYSISGDLPMAVVTVAEPRGVALIRELLLAHSYWRLRGFRVDLIILNQESPSYDRPLNIQLERLIEARAAKSDVEGQGGVFLRDWNVIPEEHRDLILSAASAVLSGGRGALRQQLSGLIEAPAQAVLMPLTNPQDRPSAPLPFLELPYFNGLGGFTPDGSEYAIYLKAREATPAPWSNVMANPGFGALVTESGLGFTWCGNSQNNRLTPWANDPLIDPQSEVIYVRDEESGEFWTPTPLPIREEGDAYRARHGQGFTVFEHNCRGICQELTVFVPQTSPMKIYRLRLRNESSIARRLTATFFAEWTLGSNREDQQLHVRTWRDEDSGALLASQSWSGYYANQVAFVHSVPQAATFSGDRAQFLGRNGSAAKPLAMTNARLDNRAGVGLDPAAALQVPISLEQGQQVDVVFILGQTASVEAARRLVEQYATGQHAEAALQRTQEWWNSRLGALEVRTPLLSVNFLLNRWLPYQALSCRFWGRSAVYQSSGAFGFRDQLQDCLAFLYFAPELAREHILSAASRQFLEGDVQHWWHSGTGLGVRTKCSDDLAWLPYATAHYIHVTGDRGILDEIVPFIEGPLLNEHESEKMFAPDKSQQTAPLWEHCRRALEKAFRLGIHGLPLFGNGDWNDGMNRVGIEGRGESTWLAWFLCTTLEAFSNVMEQHDSGATLISEWRRHRTELARAIDGSGWDGDWYLRGFFDDGSPLGSHANQEARIDSMAQSWAVISGVGATDRARRGMEAANRQLVREQDRLVLLFTPPFDRSTPNPGYIMGYPPGVRENGGQYTHGSLWMAAAWARLGEGNEAVRLLMLMNPVESARTPEAQLRYAGEPYVTAGDVSSSPGREGRAGWTWYTGSASWMYRIWIEDVLGFQLQGDKLTLAPAIPDDWPGFAISYRYRSSTYEIIVERSHLEDRVALAVDGQPQEGQSIRLVDDGRVHKVAVTLQRPRESKAASEGHTPGK